MDNNNTSGSNPSNPLSDPSQPNPGGEVSAQPTVDWSLPSTPPTTPEPQSEPQTPSPSSSPWEEATPQSQSNLQSWKSPGASTIDNPIASAQTPVQSQSSVIDYSNPAPPSYSSLSQTDPNTASLSPPAPSIPEPTPMQNVQSASLAEPPQAPPQQPLPQQQIPTSLEQDENAPTDLSQLTAGSNGNPAQGIYNPPVTAPESLVVPQDSSLTSNEAASAGSSRKLPLMAIFGAFIVLLIVAAASAYFILGIGQPKKNLDNAADQAPTQDESAIQVTKSASDSGALQQSEVATPSSFGQLKGNSSTSSATGSSALELLRQKQK